jgi:hypothetical protein
MIDARIDKALARLVGLQDASQHSRAGEGELQMQPVEAAHDLQIGRRYRPRQVVNA